MSSHDVDRERSASTTIGLGPYSTSIKWRRKSKIWQRKSTIYGTATGEHGDNSASTKKCKRKKTYAELMIEESFLLKERIHLREEIANKNATFKAKIARNEVEED